MDAAAAKSLWFSNYGPPPQHQSGYAYYQRGPVIHHSHQYPGSGPPNHSPPLKVVTSNHPPQHHPTFPQRHSPAYPPAIPQYGAPYPPHPDSAYYSSVHDPHSGIHSGHHFSPSQDFPGPQFQSPQYGSSLSNANSASSNPQWNPVKVVDYVQQQSPINTHSTQQPPRPNEQYAIPNDVDGIHKLKLDFSEFDYAMVDFDRPMFPGTNDPLDQRFSIGQFSKNPRIVGFGSH